MAWTTVALGQCGNQLAERLFDAVSADLAAWPGDSGQEGMAALFDPPPPGGRGRRRHRARCVLVDMEPKVVQASLAAARRHARWGFGSSSCVAAQSGSANNWAFGFNVHGPKHADVVLEAVRRETERADRLEGLLLLQSMAGGTGSGFGAYVTHALKDDFGAGCSIATVGVWPHETGEVMVQHYNTLLSMAHTTEDSDGMILVHNDEIADLCRRRLHLPHVSFGHMNDAIAGRLVPFLLPSTRVGAGDPVQESPWERAGAELSPGACPLRDILSRTATRQHPVLSCKVTPVLSATAKEFSTHTWDGLARHLRQMHALGTGVDETLNWRVDLDGPGRGARFQGLARCRAATVMFRGQGSDSVDTSRFATPHVFRDPAAFSVRSSPHPTANYEKSAAIMSNDDTFLPALDRLSARAQDMLHARAFTHHYERHGVDVEWFEEALLQTERLAFEYRS